MSSIILVVFKLSSNVNDYQIKFKQPEKAASITIQLIGQIEKNGFMYNAVEIVDNGIGFEQSYAEKIFEPFQRLHDLNKYEGSGVGLTIVKRVIEKHQGLIEVRSHPKVGTIFTLFFPAVPNT
ncbi:MAG: ATP-binding protein [Chryseosolibacter sp.]